MPNAYGRPWNTLLIFLQNMSHAHAIPKGSFGEPVPAKLTSKGC